MTFSIKLMPRIRVRYHISNGGRSASICLTLCADRYYRDFLTFSPTAPTNLGDAVSYYTRILKSSHDGDIYISEESIKHLGIQSSPSTSLSYTTIAT